MLSANEENHLRLVGPLCAELTKDQSAEFAFLDGEFETEPGPGVAGYFEPPYFSYFTWPRSTICSDADDRTVEEAYEQLYETLENDEVGFDGLIGFSHGATLAFGFLVHHAKSRPTQPIRNLGIRCAVFICSLPPFRQAPTGELLFDEGMAGHLEIPSLVIAGRRDFVYEHTLRLAKLCGPAPSRMLVHDRGHEIPGDPRNVREMAAAVRQLCQVAMLT
jgi:hypothetical protein